MDTMKTNAQPLTDWSQRTTATYRTQTKSSGVAVEYMVQLANTLHKDMWVNMPYLADDAYVQGFAQYVHDNLAPGLKVYVEYGNEIWNGAGPAFYPAFQYVDNYAQTHGITHQQATADLSTHDWNIWRNIFGSQTGVTFLRVAATQFSNPDLVNQEITRLVATADPTDPDHGFDVVSGAPYFTPNYSQYTAATTVQQMESDSLNAAYALAPAVDQFMAMNAKWEAALGQTIPVFMYEGGIFLTPASTVPWYHAYLQTQTDPGMYAVTLAYLNILQQHGVNGLAYYNFISPIGTNGPWGSMQYLGEPTAQTPKYDALAAFANGQTGLDSLSNFTVTGSSSATAGVSQTIKVTAIGSSGATFTGYLGTVHFTGSDAQAGLPADYVFTAADQGVHTFTITLKTAGSQSVTATDLANPSSSGSLTGVTVTAAAPGAFRVTGFPATIAGAPHNFTVTVTDSYGNPTSNYTGTVHFTTSDWEGVLPANYTFTAADAGIHTFTATLKAAYPQTITVTDTAQSSITGGQSNIPVSPSSFNAFAIWPYPSTAFVGVPYAYTISAVDAYNNTVASYTGTAHFTSTDLSATLPADYTFTAADQGIHVFNITLNSVGSRLVTVTDTMISTASGHVWVQASPPVSLNLSMGGGQVGAPPPASPTGAAQQLTVTVTGAAGATLTGYTGTLHFTSSDPKAALPADYTFKAADKGVHTFTITLKTAGSQSVTATDKSNSAITATLSGVIVKPGPLSALRVSGFPATVAGLAHTFTVSATDVNGNVITGYTGTVHFTTTDWEGTLPANYTFTAADKGVHTFTATLRAAYPESITATDVANAALSGQQTNISVTPGAFARMVIWSYPSTVAGVSNTFTVSAQDVYNNTITGYTGRVHFNSIDPQAVLPADYTFTTADKGAHSFSAALKTAGNERLSVFDVSLVSSQFNIAVTVKPAAAATLRVSGFPSATSVGVTNSFLITALDAYGNVATGYQGSIIISTVNLLAVLPPVYAFTTADAGKHTFSAIIMTPGTGSLVATDTINALVTGIETGIQAT
jgi:hypothetical protein